ncbi:MAG: YkgJ family cysteine cluster protein, partial [Bacteroidales bacterium]
KSMKVKDADRLVNGLHENEFETINCLECANCCKSLGPRLSHYDIERMAVQLKIGTSTFFDKYVKTDEDNDYVFSSMPCPFLQEDNYCVIYNSRPRACRTYPHTDQKNITSILSTCLKNTETCPAVYNIFSRICKPE